MSETPVRRVGRSGLVISRIALGTMTFGAATEAKEAHRIASAAAERGVNMIDTADTYAGGASEEITGRIIAPERNRWVLATKLANPNGAGPNARGLSRKWIMEEFTRSLDRLGTDFVDILYLHKEDKETPLEETVRTIGDLQRSGAIRYFGVSNFKAWRVARICAICDAEGIDRPVVSQPLYHALNRSIEVELLPACVDLGLGTVCYSPTARGVLSAKYTDASAPPADSRAAKQAQRMRETEFRTEALDAAAAIGSFARDRGYDPAAFAVAWTLANDAVTAALAGPRTFSQWETYAVATEVAWDDECEAFIDKLVAPGVTAVPHFIDAAYPVEGRYRGIAR